MPSRVLRCAMAYRVFAQTPGSRLDPAALVRNAHKFFEATVEVLEEDGLVRDSLTSTPWVRLRVTSVRRGFSATFRVICRAATAADWDAAREAEVRGRATGMGSLAARCNTVWEVEPEQPDSEPALLNLCALLASVALGPVLPADGGTLFGIRGAMERLEALTTRSLAR